MKLEEFCQDYDDRSLVRYIVKRFNLSNDEMKTLMENNNYVCNILIFQGNNYLDFHFDRQGNFLFMETFNRL